MISMGVFFNNNPTPNQFVEARKKDCDNDQDTESMQFEQRDSSPKAVAMDFHGPVQNIVLQTRSGDHSGYIPDNAEVDGHSRQLEVHSGENNGPETSIFRAMDSEASFLHSEQSMWAESMDDDLWSSSTTR